MFNTLDMKFREFELRARSAMPPICGDHPTIKELIDYDPFCGIPIEIDRAISWGKPTRARRFHSSGISTGMTLLPWRR